MNANLLASFSGGTGGGGGGVNIGPQYLAVSHLPCALKTVVGWLFYCRKPYLLSVKKLHFDEGNQDITIKPVYNN